MLPDTVTVLPVMANDTVPNALSTVVLANPPTFGNAVPQGTWFDYIPSPGFEGADAFLHCIAPITPSPNNCAQVTLRAGLPPVPVPVPGAAGLAGLVGMLGRLGLRRARRS